MLGRGGHGRPLAFPISVCSLLRKAETLRLANATILPLEQT